MSRKTCEPVGPGYRAAIDPSVSPAEAVALAIAKSDLPTTIERLDALLRQAPGPAQEHAIARLAEVDLRRAGPQAAIGAGGTLIHTQAPTVLETEDHRRSLPAKRRKRAASSEPGPRQ